MVINSLSDNLPSCINDYYYLIFFITYPTPKEIYIDTDNLCDSQKNKNEPTTQQFLKERKEDLANTGQD
jgi:hypothetical protein